MKTNKKDKRTIVVLSIISLASFVLFLFYDIKPNIFAFSMSLRLQKFFAIIICAICIGISTYVFQALVNNMIITPSLLGMNSLYTLVNTLVVFVFGIQSIFFINPYLSFGLVLTLMLIVSVILYGYLFKKTNYNILFILLIGSIISTLFSSIQNSLVRIMDPNAYDSLLTSLVASFNTVNSNLIGLSAIILILCIYIFRKDLSYLNILILGKNTSINLGIDYDRVSRRLLILVSILVALSTALVGPVTFLGLIVVNIGRSLIKTYRYQALIMATILLGFIFLFISQVLIEHVFNYAVPISVFINIFGGAYFLILLLRERGSM